MARQGKQGPYHHGDLRAALIETALELVRERGISNFSLAEVSRRLGVATSAPYAHFADRDELLVAVAAQVYARFYAEVAPKMDQFQEPAQRLAAMARIYVRWAFANRSLFALLYTAGLDKRQHPELEVAERPLIDAVVACVRALADGSEILADDLATAVEATAHGHALFLLYGDFGQGEPAVEDAAECAARATLALVESRLLLGR
jgi:AcrR family transcriptional regulator